MATQLVLDERLVDQAVRAGKHRSRKAAVTTALREYIRMKGRLGILDLVGTIDYDPAYDYKAERRRGNDASPAPAVRVTDAGGG